MLVVFSTIISPLLSHSSWSINFSHRKREREGERGGRKCPQRRQDVPNADELQDASKEGNLVEGAEEAGGDDEGHEAGEAQGHHGGLVLGLLPLVLFVVA